MRLIPPRAELRRRGGDDTRVTMRSQEARERRRSTARWGGTAASVWVPQPGCSTGGMDLRRPVLVLAVAGALVACGDNSDLQRGETNCDSSAEEASNPHDASCEETGANE